MNIRKRVLSIGFCGLLLFAISYASPNLTEMNAKADTTSQNSNQGEIIVHYVDQNGNQIKPETVAKGATGTTYVASIPKISGYSYSSIENGQNNANGPQMVFGGGDSSTDVMSMTIVYSSNGTSGSNKSGSTAASNSNSGSNNSGSNTVPNSTSSNKKSGNSTASNSNSGSNKSITNSASNSGSNSSSNKKSGNNTSADNTSNSNKSGDDLTSKDNDSNDIKDNNKNKSNDKSDKNNNEKDSNKKEKSNKNKDDSSKDNHLLVWTISGIVGVVVIGLLIFKLLTKKQSFRH